MYTTTIVGYNSMTPTAHVSVRKNRVKQYGGSPTKVYLKDNQEFEIELFNPKNTPVMAKIKLNGNYISTKGIYLKPGQRVFLDRFIDTPKKFLFSTYEIEANDSAAVKAIANNGDLVVEFYDEVIKYNQNPFWLTKTSNPIIGSYSYSNMDWCKANSTFRTQEVKSYYSNSSSVGGDAPTLKERSTSLETGRIEAGANSNQKFEQTYNDFNSWYSSITTYKILPDSQEPLTVQQVTTVDNFCGNCGTKITKSHYKFCPNCGEKLT
jgi:hypothetical protein